MVLEEGVEPSHLVDKTEVTDSISGLKGRKGPRYVAGVQKPVQRLLGSGRPFRFSVVIGARLRRLAASAAISHLNGRTVAQTKKSRTLPRVRLYFYHRASTGAKEITYMRSVPQASRKPEALFGQVIDKAIEYSHGEGRNNSCFGMALQLRDGTVNLLGQRRKCGVVANQRALFSTLILGTRHLSPLVKRPASQDAIVGRFQPVTTESEQIVDHSMAR